MKFVLIVAIFLVLVRDVTSLKSNKTCPTSVCRCEGGPPGKGRVINCRDLGLNYIPRFQPTDEIFYELTFGNSYDAGCSGCNSISVIPDNAFAGLRVQVIDLSKNKLSYISSLAFVNVANHLEGLHLEGNKIPTPYTEISILRRLRLLSLKNFNQMAITRENTNLETLTNLEELRLRDMNISVIASDAFVGRLPNLKRLYLEELKLGHFPAKGLKPLTRLEVLHAVYVGITTIPYSSFDSFTNLKELDLSHNRISTMAPGCFWGIDRSLEYLGLHLNLLNETGVGALGAAQWLKLKQLNLGHNEMTRIPTGLFFNMNKLEYLNLDSNAIQRIQESSFQGLDSLMFLDMSYNSLSKIPDKTFVHTPRLSELDLRGENTLFMNLTRAGVEGLENSLTKLTLTDTPVIESEMWKAVARLSKLEILELARTKLTQIPDFQFLNNKHLEYLLLEDNKISQLTQRKFHGLKDSLKNLNIQNNSITTIDQCVLNSITSLQMLYLSKNKLNCDCKLIWLRNWIAKKVQEDSFFRFMVDGKCETPTKLKGKPLWQVDEKNLVCENGYQEPVCEDLTNIVTTTQKPIQADDPNTGANPGQSAIFKFDKVVETRNGIDVSWEIEDKSYVSRQILEYQNMGLNSRTVTVEISESLNFYALTDLKPDTRYTLCLTSELRRPRLALNAAHRQCLSVKTLP